MQISKENLQNKHEASIANPGPHNIETAICSASSKNC